MLLVGPNGNAVVLMSGVGGNNPVSGVRLTFADAANGGTNFASTIRDGIFAPTGGGTLPFPAPAPQDTGKYKVR